MNQLDFISPLIRSTGKVCHRWSLFVEEKERVGLKKEKEGSAAESPSLNSSERRVPNEEMRRRGEITKTNVCPRSIWKPDTQCVGKKLSSVPGAVSGGCVAESAPPFHQTTSQSHSSTTPPRHIASCLRKQFYESQLILCSPPLVLRRTLQIR